MNNLQKELVDNYNTYLKHALNTTKDKQTAEDYVQQTYISLNNLKLNLPKKGISQYIKKCIINLHICNLRSFSKKNVNSIEDYDMLEISSNEDIQLNIEEKELNVSLKEFSDTLSVEQKKLFIKVINGNSIPEIARESNKKYDTVKACYRQVYLKARKYFT